MDKTQVLRARNGIESAFIDFEHPLQEFLGVGFGHDLEQDWTQSPIQGSNEALAPHHTSRDRRMHCLHHVDPVLRARCNEIPA
jgi:hypothetical protein